MRKHILKLVQELAVKDPDLLFLTGDVGYGVTDALREQLGERFINAGVAEANLISMAAGLGSAAIRASVGLGLSLRGVHSRGQTQARVLRDADALACGRRSGGGSSALSEARDRDRHAI